MGWWVVSLFQILVGLSGSTVSLSSQLSRLKESSLVGSGLLELAKVVVAVALEEEAVEELGSYLVERWVRKGEVVL